jgi:cobalt ECF transporter T component CbiQ
MKTSFIERTIASLLATSHYAASAEDMAAGGGVLQQVDPRVKVAGLFGLIFVVAASRELRVIGFLFAVAVLLALLSRIGLGRLFAWVWTPVLFFTGSIALPAVFLTPGHPIATIGPLFATSQGLRSAAFLVSRAETAATLSALLVLTTPWPWVLKALRTFRCPTVLVTILGMTYRYIFVILQTAFEMFESRKSRAAVGVLLSKSLQLSGDVHLAMQSRGFRGEVYVMQDFRARMADWYWVASFSALAATGLWWGR